MGARDRAGGYGGGKDGALVEALKQSGAWTVGFLTSHVWSVGGDADRGDVSTTMLQPFFSYTTKNHSTVGAKHLADAAEDGPDGGARGCC